MKTIERFCLLFLPVLAIITLILVDSDKSSFADNPQLSTAVFYVQWYDVGKSALEGLKGIKQIDKGFHNFKEINTVHYDDLKITIEKMEAVLKNAGTYQGTRK